MIQCNTIDNFQSFYFNKELAFTWKRFVGIKYNKKAKWLDIIEKMVEMMVLRKNMSDKNIDKKKYLKNQAIHKSAQQMVFLLIFWRSLHVV